ncbi:hypothetical protein [Acidocella sp. KAb 2-4]|uniref:hypothetical protein n=1 Tax=Acidocella sp. KAb 2-4 TaxID=2885158 RepID=UPI001D083298|nr:hypothetical protein [Acidocella sp. KAb 2-4]MCB5944759.1 hypothetical protein [Acidocella sp. KAb 2-4]
MAPMNSTNETDRMPRAEMGKPDWTQEQRDEFMRRRRGRNYLLLAALAAFCLMVYGIAMVKLHEYGQMW